MTDTRRKKIDTVLADRQADLTVLAEYLHKPRNFSAIVRTCEAVGINEAEKWMRVHPHENVPEACRFLRERGFQLVAAHLSDEAMDYRDLDYTVPTALVVGTELFGVSEATLEESDRQVMIPMKGMTQSLNVSVACAIVLYEAMRQREAAGLYGKLSLDRDTWESQRFEWMHPAVARFCRERGLDYPALDDDGEVIGDLPRAAT
jgi:tRNA (guanosine-2'-O-)-methyltransferase